MANGKIACRREWASLYKIGVMEWGFLGGGKSGRGSLNISKHTYAEAAALALAPWPPPLSRLPLSPLLPVLLLGLVPRCSCRMLTLQGWTGSTKRPAVPDRLSTVALLGAICMRGGAAVVRFGCQRGMPAACALVLCWPADMTATHMTAACPAQWPSGPVAQWPSGPVAQWPSVAAQPHLCGVVEAVFILWVVRVQVDKLPLIKHRGAALPAQDHCSRRRQQLRQQGAAAARGRQLAAAAQRHAALHRTHVTHCTQPHAHLLNPPRAWPPNTTRNTHLRCAACRS